MLYDEAADRWVISQYTSTSPYGECIAVCTSPDPTGTYYRYFFEFSTTIWHDFPKMSVWTDSYLASFNLVGQPYWAAVALERSRMLAGVSAMRYFYAYANRGGHGLTDIPVHLDVTSQPPANIPALFAGLDDGPNGTKVVRLSHMVIDWAAGQAYFERFADLATNFNWILLGTQWDMTQPNTQTKLGVWGDQLNYRATYRNNNGVGSLVASHTVNVSPSGVQGGARWYEIRDPFGAPYAMSL